MWKRVETIVKIHVQLEAKVNMNARKIGDMIVKIQYIHVELEANVNINGKKSGDNHKDPCQGKCKYECRDNCKDPCQGESKGG